jgi:histidinol-phosphatase
MDLEGHLSLALELADAADAITTARFRASDLVVETKPDLTPVSEADRAVEQAVLDHLAVAAPDHAVLGEEFGTRGAADAAYRWVIDPIDGTKNYVRGVPVWATLLGLECEGELVLGVVSAPALHTRWWGATGMGAFRNGESIRVSAVSALADAQASLAWETAALYHDEIGQRMIGLAHRCWRTRGFGDFWQHMLVAEGAFDISLDPVVSPWDVAALVPIIDEAGGRWTTTDGRRQADGGSFVCTNGRLHDEVLRALAGDEERRASASDE